MARGNRHRRRDVRRLGARAPRDPRVRLVPRPGRRRHLAVFVGLRGRRLPAPGRAAARRGAGGVTAAPQFRRRRRLTPVRAPPHRIERLPQQYFTALLARVAAAMTDGGEPLVDLGRGNPEVGPPPHIVDALARSAARPDGHGYAPFAGLPALKEAIAARYATVDGVELYAAREVAVVPGSKTALMEFALVAVERGETILLPDPGYADYPSAVALAGAQRASFTDLDSARGTALYLNYPSNPTAACVPDGLFAEAVRWAERGGAWVLHHFAYR